MTTDDIQITIHWHCDALTRDEGYQVFDYPAPLPCNTDFDTVDSLLNWHENDCVASCPTCGEVLEQRYEKPRMSVKQSAT